MFCHTGYSFNSERIHLKKQPELGSFASNKLAWYNLWGKLLAKQLLLTLPNASPRIEQGDLTMYSDKDGVKKYVKY